MGYVDAAFELAMQLESKAVPLPETIFVAAGTCGTVAGLVLGLKLADVRTRIIGVQVAPGMFSNPKTVLNLARKTLRLIRHHDSTVPDVKLNLEDISFEKGHLGKGYGYPTDAGESAMKLMADAEGIQLDQTYTAKTFGALLESVKNSSTNGPVLFWHTFNSIDLSQKISEVYPNSLPMKLRSYFEGKSLT